MLYVIIVGVVVTIGYLTLLTALIIGWDRIKKFEKGSQNPFPVFISVIIAVRNEEDNILNTLTSISNQSLDSYFYEVIIIDDSSSDKTGDIINEFCYQHYNFRQFSFEKHKGKKKALDFGIKQAKGDLIVTTDADCEHQIEWLQTIKNYYLRSHAKMIIAPVLVKSANWFEHMQALDFLSLIASGAAATGIQKPIMNNGANLAFTKEAYLKLNDPLNQNISSGDDIFLLLKLKKEFKNKIHFLKSKKAIVYTNPKKSLAGFISQRKRWTSKSKYYRDFDIIYTAITVLLVNLFLLTALMLAILSINFLWVFLIVFILKSILDIIFLFKTSRFFEQKFLLRYFIPLQLANLFSVPFLAFSGLFTKTKWKGKLIQ
ncbi:MAG: glycosyltransferase [Bacteroidota bacterium]